MIVSREKIEIEEGTVTLKVSDFEKLRSREDLFNQKLEQIEEIQKKLRSIIHEGVEKGYSFDQLLLTDRTSMNPQPHISMSDLLKDVLLTQINKL